MKNSIKLSYYKLVIFAVVSLIALNNNAFAGELRINASQVFTEEPKFNYIDVQYKYPRVMTSNIDAKVLNVNSGNLQSMISNNVNEFVFENYPISTTQTANVKFIKSNAAVGTGTRWIRVTDDGEILEPGFEPLFYVGTIENEADSKVTLFLYNNDLYSVIERQDNENFSISPSTGLAEKNIHILTSQSTSSLGPDYNPFLDVHFDGQESIDFEKYIKKANETQSTELLQADIIIEATYDFYKLFNDHSKTVAYISAIMTHSSQIFQTNIYVTLFVPQVIIYQSKNKDPYGNTTQIIERLEQLIANWKSKTVKRALVCLLTDIDYQGGSGGYRIGGVSSGLGTLCKNSQAYCVFGMQGHYTYPTSNYTWDVSVSAHEMGHAFGAPHTHACYFKPNMIDTCITRYIPQNSDGCVTSGNPIPRLGTLMSYCHLTNSSRSVGLYFHDRIKPIIRGFAEDAPCLKKAVDATLILLYPTGGTTLFQGDTISIRWASSKVESVAIKYSLDNGKTWAWVETYADAIKGQYLWTVPNTISNQVLFHIFDSFDASIYDEVITPCYINKPTLQFKNPDANARLGKNDKYIIDWNQLFVSSIKIEFSSDVNLGIDNAVWNHVSENVLGTSYVWSVPDILSDNCMLKMTGIADNGKPITTYSEKFAIGQSFCELLGPEPGEVLCANSTYELRWNADYVTNLYIQYTTDEGTSWRHLVFNGVKANLGKYSWKVPSNYSDKCYFRISQLENKTKILAQNEKAFIIDSCATDVNYAFNSKGAVLSLSDITPNPANNKIKVNFNYLSSIIRTIDIAIVNSKGEELLISSVKPERYGQNQIEIDVSKLPQGNYLLVLQSGTNNVSKNLVIIK